MSNFSLTPNATASQVVFELQHSLEQAGYVLADVRLYADNKVGVTLGQVHEIRINGLSERPVDVDIDTATLTDQQ